MVREFNNLILNQASKLKYRVADIAPASELELLGESSLVVWSGASDRTIWGDKRVNWAFRALHDAMHKQSGLSFSIEHEVALGRLQANKYTGLLADLVYLEVAGQALYYKQHGCFILNQVEWTLDQLRKLGYKI